MQIHFVSFIGLAPNAEKTKHSLGTLDDLIERQKVLSQSALDFGKVDYVHLFSRDELVKTEYYRSNKTLLDQPRGCGYWAWKPYIILQTLKKTRLNDYVIYCDVGKPTENAKEDHGNIITTSLKPMVDWAERNDGLLPGVYLSNHGPAKNWIKRDAFILMKCDKERFHEMPTVQAGYTVWKNTPQVIGFLEKWQIHNLDTRLISDQKNTLGQENYLGFERNCHDQATLTLLCEKNNLTVLGDRKKQFFGFRNINYIAHEAAYQNADINNELVLKRLNSIHQILPNYLIRWVELFFQSRRIGVKSIGIVGALNDDQKTLWRRYFPNVSIVQLDVDELVKKKQSFDLLLVLSLDKVFFNEGLLMNSYASLEYDGVALFLPIPNIKSEFEEAARSVSTIGEFSKKMLEAQGLKDSHEPKIPNSRNPIFVSGKSKKGELETTCILIKPSEINTKFMSNIESKHNAIEPVRAAQLPPLPKVRQIAMLVDDINFSQVDLYAQLILRELPEDAHANLACAWVASFFDLSEKQKKHLEKAKSGAKEANRELEMIALDLNIKLNDITLPTRIDKTNNQDSKKYHLAKAWGFGFGSEMSALMGQAYLAEVTNRELIVHWGSNFLYRPHDGNDCVFDCYFERFNDLTVDSIEEKISDIFPAKWTKKNIVNENVNKRKGQYSKLSALYFLNKSESLTVSDYYTGVIHVKPWVNTTSYLSHLNVDDTYRYLAKKYLRPKQEIIDQVDEFIHENLSKPFIAVHARGSDKDEGYRALTSIPGKILQCAKQRLNQMPSRTKLFLMTDDTALLEVYKSEFGDRLVQTDCQRCDSQVGVHYDEGTNKLQAGREMLIDMLIASRAETFVGLGLSNPSQLITYFGDFSADNYILFGENRLKQFNTHLYKTISVR